MSSTLAYSQSLFSAAWRSRRRAAHGVAVGGMVVLIASLGAANGGYFPSSFGWASLLLVWAVVLALAAAPIALARLELALLAGLALIAAWTWVSVLWAADPASAVDDATRTVLYLAGPTALLFIARRRFVGLYIAGALTACALVSGYALLTRIVPDRFGLFDPLAVYRLAAPLGYWNALGILVAIATILAVGAAADSIAALAPICAGALLVLFLVTLYFTYSRGAWAALAAGLFALVGLAGERRLRTALVVVSALFAPAVAVLLASHSSALTHKRARLADAATQGHRLLLWLVGLAVVGALVTFSSLLVARRLRATGRSGLVVVLGVTAVVVAVGVTGLIQAGGPVTAAKHAWHSFTRKPPPVTNLNSRLFSFSGNGRIDQWRVATHEIGDHFLIGAGAGGFERYWLEHRPRVLKVRDAHSLYLEVFAELGVVGLALLIGALAVPLVAAVRSRKRRFVPALGASYVAFLVHAGVDWDWEVPAVTLTALLLASLLLVATRVEAAEKRRLGRGASLAALATTSIVGVAVLVLLAGNLALSRASAALRDGAWSRAETNAKRADRWAPWSPEPLRILANAQLAQGRSVAAQESLRRALDKDEGNWAIWFDLARASTGRLQREALSKAQVLNPLSPELAEFRHEISYTGPIEAVGGG